ncbi:MAG: hypothetical protein ACTHL8_24160 [Burkholderiaceae bacterium]
MQRIRRVLAACVPFAAIVAVFAAAVAWHLGEPQRQADRFHRLIAEDVPLARDYGDDARVVLTRRGCAQQCSAYTVSITGAGVVAFAGRADVCAATPMTDQVSRATAQRLVGAMVHAGFDDLPTTGAMARRGPGEQSAVVILEVGGRRHAADDRLLPERPLLAAIEQQVDRVAGTARWLPAPGGACGAPVPRPGAPSA